MEPMDRRKAEMLLKRHGIETLPLEPARTISEALGLAGRMGFPLALKVNSPDITHKTDVGGVMLNIGNEEELVASWERMMKSVREKAPKARVLGVKTDQQFGRMLAFGLGGIFVEVLRDVSFRLIPVTRQDAREMLGEIRGKKVLEGFRGQMPVPARMLEDILLKVSAMAEKNPQMREMDINPLLADSEKAIAADFRIFV